MLRFLHRTQTESHGENNGSTRTLKGVNKGTERLSTTPLCQTGLLGLGRQEPPLRTWG